MDTQESNEELDFEIEPEYFEKILSKINWDKCPISVNPLNPLSIKDKLIIALLTQNNLLLDKLCHIMLLATGLKPHDISELDGLDKESMKELLGKSSTMCGHCGKIVVPDLLGYCPKCKNDLRRQLNSEF